jgi:hypothetical protein
MYWPTLESATASTNLSEHHAHHIDRHVRSDQGELLERKAFDSGTTDSLGRLSRPRRETLVLVEPTLERISYESLE